jgi:formate hydrogenlyase subunit 3/multisubunit Na+/H+ antiporter MnhD subunit
VIRVYFGAPKTWLGIFSAVLATIVIFGVLFVLLLPMDGQRTDHSSVALIAGAVGVVGGTFFGASLERARKK